MNNKVKKYRKKPVVIEAIQFDGKNVEEVFMFMRQGQPHKDGDKIVIPTLEGKMTGDVGDYIIKGIQGEFYPCKADIFEKTYDIVEE